MNDSEKPFSLGEKISLLCFLVVMTAVMAVMTTLELGIVLHLSFVRSFVNLGMKAGSTLWTLMTAAVWWELFFDKQQPKQDPLWVRITTGLVITTFAACTQASIHWGGFVSVSHWANAIMSTLFLMVLMLDVIPQIWKLPIAQAVEVGS